MPPRPSVYQKLSVYVSEMIRLQGGSVFDTATWDTMTRNRRRGIREALDAARASIASVGRLHVGKSRRMDQMLTLLHCADQSGELADMSPAQVRRFMAGVHEKTISALRGIADHGPRFKLSHMMVPAGFSLNDDKFVKFRGKGGPGA